MKMTKVTVKKLLLNVDGTFKNVVSVDEDIDFEVYCDEKTSEVLYGYVTVKNTGVVIQIFYKGDVDEFFKDFAKCYNETHRQLEDIKRDKELKMGK